MKETFKRKNQIDVGQQFSSSHSHQNKEECFYPLNSGSCTLQTFCHHQEFSCCIWKFCLFGSSGRWIWSAWRHCFPWTDFSLFICCRRVQQRRSIAALAEIVRLLVCCGSFWLLGSLRWHLSACLVASHPAQSDCGGSKGVVGVHARVKRKSERSEMHLTCKTAR